jgi:cytochrome P450
MPFGGGHRRCIGANFSLYEMKQVLAQVFHRHRFRPVSPAPVRPAMHNFVLGPASDVPMVYEGAL